MLRTPRDLFRPRPPHPVSVCELLALDLGWSPAIAAHYAAFEAGIRASRGWTPEEIEAVVFLRQTVERWR